MTPPAQLVAFTVALVTSLVIAVPLRRLAIYIGMVDHPGPRKLQQKPVPLLGGLAVYSGVLLAVVLSQHGGARAEILAILGAATLIAVVGVLDDGGLLHHQVKLFVGMPVAALMLIASGIRAHVLSTFWPSAWGVILDVILTLFWVVGITAAFSILDHMDGLCAGVAAVAASFFALLAILHGQLWVGTLAAAILGAALGFLRWNFNPAKIFLGDAGAMFLGFLLAALSLKLRPSAPAPVMGWLIPVLILGVPVLDTTLICVSRARRGLIPFTSPGKDHAAHRLANLGLSHRSASLALCGLGVLCGFLALLMGQLPLRAAYGLLAVLLAAWAAAIFLLERAPFECQSKE